MTPSCTAALEMAAKLCDLGPGDEVIVPSYTFVSTASAFVRLGARPVFVEIRPDTLNIDESRIEEAITPRTRAIFPVHYAGVACEMDEILDDRPPPPPAGRRGRRTRRQRLLQGPGPRVDGRPGHLQLPRHQEPGLRRGGCPVRQRPRADRAGRDPPRQGDQPRQVLPGRGRQVHLGRCRARRTSPARSACAFLAAQLEAMDAIKARRREIDRHYRRRLAPLEAEGLLRLPVVPPECESHYRTFHILLGDGRIRDGLMAFLKRHGVSAVFHFVPLHLSPMGRSFGYRPGDLPLTEDLAGRLLRLPVLRDDHRSRAGSGRRPGRGLPEQERAMAGRWRTPSRRRSPLARGCAAMSAAAAAAAARRPPDLSIVVPVYRSADCLEALAAAVASALGPTELDVRGDPGQRRLARPHLGGGRAALPGRPAVVGVDLRRNFGQDNAILTGLRMARGRLVAVMDDDLQHDPADLPALLARLEAGPNGVPPDVVYADFRRQAPGGLEEPGELVQRQGRRVGPRQAAGRLPLALQGPPPRGGRADLPLRRPRALRRRPALPGDLAVRQVDGRAPPAVRRAEQLRPACGPLAVWARLATGFSVRPLRLVTWCGLALGALGGLLAAAVVVYRLVYPERFAAAVAGWASLMVGLLVIGGVQMVFLGVLGEYVGRMHTAVGRQEAAGDRPRRGPRRPATRTGMRGESGREPGLPQRPRLRDCVMLALYGRHYGARYRAVADLIPDGSSVLDLCCGPGRPLRSLPPCAGRSTTRASTSTPGSSRG